MQHWIASKSRGLPWSELPAQIDFPVIRHLKVSEGPFEQYPCTFGIFGDLSMINGTESP
jgi:hypothetical protein